MARARPEVLVVADGIVVGWVRDYAITARHGATLEVDLRHGGGVALLEAFRPVEEPNPWPDRWTLAPGPDGSHPGLVVHVEDRPRRRFRVELRSGDTADDLRVDLERLPSVLRLAMVNHGLERAEAERLADGCVASLGFGGDHA